MSGLAAVGVAADGVVDLPSWRASPTGFSPAGQPSSETRREEGAGVSLGARRSALMCSPGFLVRLSLSLFPAVRFAASGDSSSFIAPRAF